MKSKKTNKFVRFLKILFKRHIPTYSYCNDPDTQKVILAAFDTCTFYVQ